MTPDSSSGTSPSPAAGLPADERSAADPSVREVLRGVAAVLADAGVGSPEADARTLLAHALGRDTLGYPLPEALSRAELSALAAATERRARREPLQHITGRAPFRHLVLRVEAGVFVPRPETEVVAQVAIDEAADLLASGTVPVVVDLCCGAGGIAVSLASEVVGAQVHAVDLSPAAVELTRANAAAAGADLAVVIGDVRDAGLLAALAGRVDVLVANPPYIPPDQVPVDPEVRDHDPDLALYGGGPDGLDVPRAVVARAVTLLAPGGLLVMEHAEVQAAAVRALVEETGAFGEVTTRADLTGRDRMVRARRLAA